jgi:hypothetical protein
MPTISERQLLIEAILLAGEEDTDQHHRTEPTAIDESGEEDDPSLSPSKSSESSLESSSSELSSCSESDSGLESEDTDEENTRQHMVDIL